MCAEVFLRSATALHATASLSAEKDYLVRKEYLDDSRTHPSVDRGRWWRWLIPLPLASAAGDFFAAGRAASRRVVLSARAQPHVPHARSLPRAGAGSPGARGGNPSHAGVPQAHAGLARTRGVPVDRAGSADHRSSRKPHPGAALLVLSPEPAGAAAAGRGQTTRL